MSQLAAQVLVENADPAVVPGLIGLLRAGAGDVTKAAYVLGRYRAREAIPALADALRRAPQDGALGYACASASAPVDHGVMPNKSDKTCA